MSSRVNEVNGEYLQDPPIKNPGYANDRQGTAQRAVSVKTVLNVAQMFVELHLISPALRE